MGNRVAIGRYETCTATIDSQIGAGMFYMKNVSGDDYTKIRLGQGIEGTGYTANNSYVTWLSGTRMHMTYSLNIDAGTRLTFIDNGLFIAQAGDNVLDPSNNLAFDSRTAAGLFVAMSGTTPLKGEGSISAPTGNASGNTTTATISHSLGYTPAYAVRWCYANDLSSGVATQMYTPTDWYGLKIQMYGFNVYVYKGYGGCTATMDDDELVITNHESGTDHPSGTSYEMPARDVYYAYTIFAQKDFTGGKSL